MLFRTFCIAHTGQNPIKLTLVRAETHPTLHRLKPLGCAQPKMQGSSIALRSRQSVCSVSRVDTCADPAGAISDLQLTISCTDVTMQLLCRLSTLVRFRICIQPLLDSPAFCTYLQLIPYLFVNMRGDNSCMLKCSC